MTKMHEKWRMMRVSKEREAQGAIADLGWRPESSQALLEGSTFPRSVRSTTNDYGGIPRSKWSAPVWRLRKLERIRKKQSQPNPGRRGVPMKLVPGGGASAFSTEGGDDTRSRTASWPGYSSGPKCSCARATPTCKWTKLTVVTLRYTSSHLTRT